MVVTLHRETLESSSIEVAVPDRPVRNAPAYGVRVREPPKKVRQLAVFLRPNWHFSFGSISVVAPPVSWPVVNGYHF
jgi:hypothetical protein